MSKLRESTSIRIQKTIWHRAKIEAAIQKVNLSDLIEKSLEMFIKQNGSQITIKPNGETKHKIPSFEF